MATNTTPIATTEHVASPQPAHIQERPQESDVAAPIRIRDSTQTSEPPPGYVEQNDDMILKTGRDPNSNPQTFTNTQPKATAPPEPKIPNYVIDLKDLGEEPDWIDCPHCKSRQKTTVTHPDSSAKTLAGLFCCLFCGVITVCIPCLCHWFAETDHHCGGCKKLVAHKPHDGQMEPRLPVPSQGTKYKPSQYNAMSEEERMRIGSTGVGVNETEKLGTGEVRN